ncbi:hypothetical protein H6P81_009916 [Aristolochia fimbriata]|uniref:Uncharacterized protein n=1 Tax=Aristolochia fimbriata TaxID=158543 RepID=A0AAV7EPZ3_ARIFI|nr:hypothetical protein H6P81_009916 [Aristolochia fimbriata]
MSDFSVPDNVRRVCDTFVTGRKVSDSDTSCQSRPRIDAAHRPGAETREWGVGPGWCTRRGKGPSNGDSWFVGREDPRKRSHVFMAFSLSLYGIPPRHHFHYKFRKAERPVRVRPPPRLSPLLFLNLSLILNTLPSIVRPSRRTKVIPLASLQGKNLASAVAAFGTVPRMRPRRHDELGSELHWCSEAESVSRMLVQWKRVCVEVTGEFAVRRISVANLSEYGDAFYLRSFSSVVCFPQSIKYRRVPAVQPHP